MMEADKESSGKVWRRDMKGGHGCCLPFCLQFPRTFAAISFLFGSGPWYPPYPSVRCELCKGTCVQGVERVYVYVYVSVSV